MIINRALDVAALVQRKSFFLLGPRATGKSFLIRHQLGGKALVIDLLRSDLYLRLSADPGLLESLIDGGRSNASSPIGPTGPIVIDEVQKLPSLLDEVHRLIEERRMRFVLTGSSARKLKRGHANLLGGRAWTAHLFPLTYAELPQFDLPRFLRYGGLPPVVLSDHPDEELHAYVRTYLHEEIQAEGLVRRLPAFSRFLTTAALTNGHMLNFAKIGNESGLPAATVREHYFLLEDTLVGFLLPAWVKSKRRKAIGTAKFYFFDTGVTHALAGTTALERNSDLYGRSFEQWLAMELRAYLDYRRRREPMAYWRSTADHEVDFVIGDHTAIEAKSTKRVTRSDLRGLQALAEEKIVRRLFLVSEDPIEAKHGPIRCLPWRRFLDELWSDTLL
jgi:predicted AAA+ superfamily ATPase